MLLLNQVKTHLVLHQRRGVCLDEFQKKEENEFGIVGSSKLAIPIFAKVYKIRKIRKQS